MLLLLLSNAFQGVVVLVVVVCSHFVNISSIVLAFSALTLLVSIHPV